MKLEEAPHFEPRREEAEDYWRGEAKRIRRVLESLSRMGSMQDSEEDQPQQ